MPRSKISKKAKLKREADIRKEKIRIFELKMEAVMMSLDDMEVRYKTMVNNQLQLIESKLHPQLREMKMPVFLELLLQLDNFSDFKPSDHPQHVAKPAPLHSAHARREPRSRSACDGNKVLATASATPSCWRSNLPKPAPLHSAHARREPRSRSACDGNKVLATASATPSCWRSNLPKPAPLHSAHARREPRSRSACDGNKVLATASATPSCWRSNLPKPAPLHSAHARREPRSRSACDGNKVLATASATPSCWRSKLPIPLATHKRSLSADGMPRQKHQSLASTPPMAFLRWPKPGELAISKMGSPILAQVQKDNVANVNIPIRGGVLSLRPTKLDEIQPDLLKNLNANTLNQIRTLHENLQLIMEAADKAGMK